MRALSAFISCGLLLFINFQAWLDYDHAFPMPGQVHSVHRGRQGQDRIREYDFGTCTYTVVERDPAAAWLCGLVGADAPELNGVVEGDRVILWALLASGRATPVLRMPIATLLAPLFSFGLLWVAVAPPAGRMAARRDRHRCLGCIFAETMRMALVLGALFLIAWGVAAPFLEGESTMREGLAFVSAGMLLVPVITLARRLQPATS